MTREEILARIKKYCIYRDRCHQEVRFKLLNMKVYGELLEETMAELIGEDFLNEERFAKSYVRGKHQIKKWGKRKIILELQRKNVSEYCIKKGLSEIDEDDYQKTLILLLKKYFERRRDKLSKRAWKNALYNYAVGKGYEPDKILKTLEKEEFN